LSSSQMWSKWNASCKSISVKYLVLCSWSSSVSIEGTEY